MDGPGSGREAIRGATDALDGGIRCISGQARWACPLLRGRSTAYCFGAGAEPAGIENTLSSALGDSSILSMLICST
jgi:hypothetical protein